MCFHHGSMDFAFDRHEIRVKEARNLPLEVADVRHPSRGEWRNRGIDFYKEVFSEADYATYSARQFANPMPDPSPRVRRELARLLWRTRVMFGTKALFTGKRATHTWGVAARGTIDVPAKPEFPEHEFFAAGRRFGCRLRHANASFADDVICQVRGCSIKFADADFDSPFDLVMNSGATSAFWTFESFMAFGDARATDQAFGPVNDWVFQKRWMKRWPAAFPGTVESARSLPSSYADVTYYSKIAYPFKAKDGRRRYAKYRLIRCGLERESGLLDEADQRRCWWQSRDPSDTRPKRVLQREFLDRLAKPVEYDLQIQLHEWDDERDTEEVLNLCRYWDEDTHPWLDLARVTLTSALSEAEMAATKVWLGHQPPSLGISDAYCKQQYGSLPWARVHVYPVSQRFRRR